MDAIHKEVTKAGTKIDQIEKVPKKVYTSEGPAQRRLYTPGHFSSWQLYTLEDLGHEASTCWSAFDNGEKS